MFIELMILNVTLVHTENRFNGIATAGANTHQLLVGRITIEIDQSPWKSTAWSCPVYIDTGWISVSPGRIILTITGSIQIELRTLWHSN